MLTEEQEREYERLQRCTYDAYCGATNARIHLTLSTRADTKAREQALFDYSEKLVEELITVNKLLAFINEHPETRKEG